MRVEIVDNEDSRSPAVVFPPVDDYVDLRQNPHEVDRITAARQHSPLRNFLADVNAPESAFVSASVHVQPESTAQVRGGGSYQLVFRTILVFADSSLNLQRDRYANLASSMLELLERDSGDAVRTELRILPCEFPAEKRIGFCLSLRMVALGMSPQQAEMRWGLGLARLQQALLFRVRTLKQ